MKIRFIIPALLISVGLLYVACGPPPEKSPAKAGAAKVEKKAADKTKAVRVKHISGEILAKASPNQEEILVVPVDL